MKIKFHGSESELNVLVSLIRQETVTPPEEKPMIEFTIGPVREQKKL